MTKAAPLSDSDMKSLLIEGWRGISHSFGVVNQSQILALNALKGLTLYHRDLPFAFPHWTRSAHGAGLPAADQALIDALGDPGDVAVDCVYRIASPFLPSADDDRRRAVTFMVTEIGLSNEYFVGGVASMPAFTRDDNWVTTPSTWSMNRLAEAGLPAERIRVIPHGVDCTVFRPLTTEERLANRAGLGIDPSATVFLNVGLSAWNKGVDVLLVAFAKLKSAGHNVRLILKDQKELYGRSVQTMVTELGKTHPELRAADTLAAISVVSNTMSRADLRLLYGIADAYVSPYRAEGFNLPVLEAIACGTPVIVTRGGATDDFCTDEVALRIPGTLGNHTDAATGLIGRFIEPDLSALIDAMVRFAPGRPNPLPSFKAASALVASRFSWQAAARQLAELTVGLLPTPEAAAPSQAIRIPPALKPVNQQDVLDFIAALRPLTMERTTKVRIGNDYDGGYVLPDVALECDAVLSVGVGPDVSFDIALAERGALIAQFDHTVEKPPSDHPNCTFYKLGWGVETQGDLVSFNDMAALFAKLPRKRAMLKFDIEGAEYDVLPAVDPQALRQFDVIVCEIHDLDKLMDPGFHHAARRCLETLTAFHAPVHLHANNYAPVTLVAGVPIPNVVELSFLRRDLDIFSGRALDPIPGPLDKPNHPYRLDICMNAF